MTAEANLCQPPPGPPNHNRDDLRAKIRSLAQELGFTKVGFATLGEPASFHRFESWLEDDAHGTMRYLENYREIRADTRQLEPSMRSAIVLLTPYEPEPFDLCASTPSLIARYALGDDYHELLRDKMRSLGEQIEEATGARVNLRPAVDSAPILERDLAQRAGLGWTGKSTMLLSQTTGTYQFISELFTDLDIGEDNEPAEDRCGRCTSCIDACPTGAISDSYYVDARRCISYLTIELRGAIPRNLRALIGEHIFGCDICQEVCPWNKFAEPAAMIELTPREAYRHLRPEDVLTLSQSEFSSLFRNSSIKRAKRRGLARNAAVVLGNQRRPETLPTLVRALHEHDEPLARGHSAWALSQFTESGDIRVRDELCMALKVETEPGVIEEIAWAEQDLAHRLA